MSSTSSRKSKNKNVSVSFLSRNEKEEIKSLVVKPRNIASVHGNTKASCWKYVGFIHENETAVNPIDSKRYYCSVCLEEEKKGASFHISKVSNFSCGTSTGNINRHLFDKHEIVVENSQAGIPLILNYFTRHRKSDVGSSSMPVTQHELNRDILIWFVRDLLAFENVAKPGFTDFMKKILPTCETPCPETLSGTALNDVYLAVFTKVKEELSQVRAICVMSDGWTDRYHGRNLVFSGSVPTPSAEIL